MTSGRAATAPAPAGSVNEQEHVVASPNGVVTSPNDIVSTPNDIVATPNYVHSRAPLYVYWETSLACGPSCQHARETAAISKATATTSTAHTTAADTSTADTTSADTSTADTTASPGPNELTTLEGVALLDRITGFGRPFPHLVLTGGDPLRRADLQTLVEEATARGIGTSLATAAPAGLTSQRLASLKASGIQAISLHIDGSDARRHDALRSGPRTFGDTVRAVGWARDLNLPVQVRTLVTAETLPDLPAVHELLLDLGITEWSLSYVITVGRGSGISEVSPIESERLNHWLCGLSKQTPFVIRTVEATHYRRTAIRQMRHEGMDDESIATTSVGATFGVRDGNGTMFIAHDGSVNPSGFLPIHTGDVRSDDVVTLYREHPVFTSLRDASSYKGRCGCCLYTDTCGGSRARAFFRTGDYLESDPLCLFVPQGDRASRTTGALRADGAAPAEVPS